MGICATAFFASVFLRLDWLWIFSACRNDGNKYMITKKEKENTGKEKKMKKDRTKSQTISYVAETLRRTTQNIDRTDISTVIDAIRRGP